MATQVQWRGGSTSEHNTFTGAARELTVDTTKQTVVVHDGSTVGGHPLQKQFPPVGSAAAPTYTFTGDTNTGIYSPGADQVAISTNGTGRLFVDASGNVGVATASPGTALEVNGTIRSGTGSGASLSTGSIDVGKDIGLADGQGIVLGSARRIAISSTGTTTLNAASATAPFIANIGASEVARIDSSGRLGLGTSSAESKLDVRDAAVCQVIAGLTGGQKITIGSDTSTGAYVGTLDNYDLKFIRNSSVVGVWTSTGLGIGTNSAISKLHVSNSGAEGFEFTPGAASNTNLLTHYNRNGSFVYVNSQVSAASHQFFIGASEAARIDASSRLLVGTSTSTMSGSAVQQNGNLGIIASNATNVATNGTLDIVVNSGGGCYSGFLIVENTLASNAASRTQTTYAVLGRGTSATATSIATLNGSTSGASFTLTYPSNGTIRVTNTHGGATNINMAWFGPTGY